MAESDKEGRRSDPSQDASASKSQDAIGRSDGAASVTDQNDGRQWTLRRIEGVIGSVA